jgi:hypothetical protein
MRKHISFSSLVVIVIIALSCNSNVKSKNKSIQKNTTYTFLSNDKTSSEFNFKSYRKFVNDSVFIDNGILCSDDTANVCAFKCYIKNNDWYIWCGNSWSLLYSARNKKLESIKTLYDTKMIEPISVYKLNLDTLYSFYYKTKDIDHSSGETEYLFSPKHGVVILYDVSGFLFRTDFDTSNLLQTIRAKEN